MDFIKLQVTACLQGVSRSSNHGLGVTLDPVHKFFIFLRDAFT